MSRVCWFLAYMLFITYYTILILKDKLRVGCGYTIRIVKQEKIELEVIKRYYSLECKSIF